MSTLSNSLARHQFKAYTDRPALEESMVSSICLIVNEAIASQGRASLAFSGGSTPKAMFALLSQADLDWEKVTISLVDERWVNNDHDQSNERMFRENILQNKATSATLVGMKSAHDDINTGVSDYQSKLETKIPLPFDLVVLGMGNDGHTASWFPDAAQLPQAMDVNSEQWVVTTTPASQPTDRITLSIVPVMAAKHVFLHITGDEKKQVLEKGINSEPCLPIHQSLDLLTQAVDIYWAE
jgi:6-phosphogluconolactonase